MKYYYDLHIHSCLSPCADMDMTPHSIAGMSYINGLDIIAVADHNSAKNLRAVKKACEEFNILLVPAIEAVYKGQSVFGGDIIGKLPDMTKEHSSDDDKFWNKGITEKEFEIIKLVADGLSNKEIASRLYLGEGTVRNYFSSILDKLELRDRTQLVVYYYKN